MVCEYSRRSPVVRHDTRKPGSMPRFLTFTSRITAHRIAAIALILSSWRRGSVAFSLTSVAGTETTRLSIAHTRFELAFEVLYIPHTPWELLAHMHLYIAILLIVFTPSAHRHFRGASGGLTASSANSRNHIYSNCPGASSTTAEPTDPIAALK